MRYSTRIDDEQEINSYGTDPNVADSDGDQVIDGQELLNGTDPLDDDSDDDGVDDGMERDQGSDPLDPESRTPAEDDEVKSGCSTSASPIGWWPMILLLGLVRRRR